MRAYLATVLWLTMAGCSSVSSHPLKLVTEVATPCDPSKMPGCRPTYVSCEQLDLKELTLRVGIFETESTTVSCPAMLSDGPALVQVNYRTGEPFYMIDTSFLREGLNQNVSAGPFSDADSEWQMFIR
jgi:hypothetical protein